MALPHCMDCIHSVLLNCGLSYTGRAMFQDAETVRGKSTSSVTPGINEVALPIENLVHRIAQVAISAEHPDILSHHSRESQVRWSYDGRNPSILVGQ